MTTAYLDVVFDGPPGPECGRFIEIEDDKGASVSFGEWVQRKDGYWMLRLWADCHTHRAGTMADPPQDIDQCARCGHDIRHPIHAAKNQILS